MATFPELAELLHEKLIKLDKEWMKSPGGKERWANFINWYEKKVQEHNSGSLICTDAREEYGGKNTIFGMLPTLSSNDDLTKLFS
ncbi:hypothetical protein E1B28_012103 [Marasmius oreades]|uniref:Polysaccharide biosynthesis domain-containing protein n=1 Tax=Marasmius oreades TaxID=181124 RepID=A0A9P7RRF0_9AGAR|nr:uncharacterized protein E1B28_012103 [Marasmius oreades]KAG7088072.1 hypothetical protein E1B28_012103 [Marasmius oreades]